MTNFINIQNCSRDAHRIRFVVLLLCVLSVLSSHQAAASSGNTPTWEFFVGDFSYPEVPAPSQWRTFDPAGRPPGKGSDSKVVWYRYLIPEHVQAEHYFYVPGVYQLYQVYHEQTRVLTFGEFDSQNAEELLGQKFHLIKLPEGKSGTHLYFRIFSKFRNVGFNGVTRTGTKEELIVHIVRNDLARTILAALFVFIGLFQFFLFRSRNEFTEYLAFGGFAVLFGLHTFARTNLKQIILDAPVFWKYVEILTVLYLPIFLCIFVEKTFGAGFANIIRFLKRFSVFFSTAVTLFAVRDLALLEHAESLYNMLLIPGCGVLIFGVLFEKSAKKKDVMVFAAGMVSLALTGMLDGLVVGGDLPYFDPVAPWGTLMFLFSFQYVLSQKVASARILKFEVERDLETAALFTTAFLPEQSQKSDKFEIEVIFHPAGQIGGDWYSYYVEKDRWLHVHIGDVTGHSTAAALIAAFSKGATDMLYSNSRQDRRETLRLEALHTNLNSILCSSRALNPLMTLFSAVIDLETGIMRYINSGHTFPLLVASGSAPVLLTGKNRNLLGFLGRAPEFISESIQLQGHESLFLYSDGYLDATGLNSPKGIRELKSRIGSAVNDAGETIATMARQLLSEHKADEKSSDDITSISLKFSFKPASSTKTA